MSEIGLLETAFLCFVFLPLLPLSATSIDLFSSVSFIDDALDLLKTGKQVV